MTGMFPVGQYGYSYGWSASLYARAAAGPAGTAEQGAAGPVEPVRAPASVGPRASEALTAGTELPPVREGTDPVEMAVRGRIRYLDQEEAAGEAAAPEEGEAAQSPREVMEAAECQTCKDRKYQDDSDDPGVSFKTATNVAPERAAAAVRGHEQEHVVREQAKAAREGRKVVSQSVTIHTGICPECGEVYVSGGTTRTTTMADSREPLLQQEEKEAAAA